MKVICAGYSKTGTKSLASALRILGYSVHDVEEQWVFHMVEYTKALEGKEMPDFAAMYADVDAVTDTPANYYYEEISKAFPEAKVVLSLRDNEEEWLDSFKKTASVWKEIATQYWVILGFICTPTGRKWAKLLQAMHKYKMKEYDANSIEILKELYMEHNARVKEVIPRDKLLVFNVKQGWRPLCEFLGAEVPDVPFPRSNVNSKLIPGLITESAIGKKVFKELVAVLAVSVVILAAFGYLIFSKI